MRIISGLFKGKKILEPKDTTTRHLKDLTKESIFNIISHSNKFRLELSNVRVLDLFSGTGSFGIECLSRGFKEVVFIENYLGVLPILKKNLSNLKSIHNYKIIEKNINKKKIFLNLNKKFDIIFLDPPFRERKLNSLIDQIKNQDLLNKNGIIITHRHKKDNLDLSDRLNIIDERSYGISKIIIGI